MWTLANARTDLEIFLVQERFQLLGCETHGFQQR